MSDYEISQLSALTAPAAGDLLVIVDTSDTSTPPAGAAGSDKQITYANLALSGRTMLGYLAPKVVTLTDGSSVAINAALGNVFDWALAGSSHTLAAPSNPVNGQSVKVRIAYSGSFTPLFNAIYDFGAAGQPTWTATSGKVDEVAFEYNSNISKWCYQGSGLGY